MTRFETFWTGRFGTIPAAGFMLRAALPDRWVRFHSLPHAQRYPRSDAEMEMVLSRYRTLADHVLGENAECFLAQISFAHPDFVDDSYDYQGQPMDRLGPLPSRHEDEALLVHACPVRWTAEGHTDLLREIAEGMGPHSLFVSRQTGAVFAPYDGGSDIIAVTPEARDGLRSGFSDWLSARADGL